jgi:hypothetical protein
VAQGGEKDGRKEGKVRTGARKAGLAETLPDYQEVVVGSVRAGVRECDEYSTAEDTLV